MLSWFVINLLYVGYVGYVDDDVQTNSRLLVRSELFVFCVVLYEYF